MSYSFVRGFLTLACLTLVATGKADETHEKAITSYPAARRVDAFDTFHGVKVVDPYRWMEEMESEEVVAWVRAQDDLFRSYVNDSRVTDWLRKRIGEIRRFGSYSTPTQAGGQLFFSWADAGANRRTVLVQKGLSGKAKVLIDPDQFRYFQESQWQLNGWGPSPDGRLLAFGLSKGQSAWRRIKFLDVKTGTIRADELSGLGDFSSIQWTSDGSGIFYRRYDLPDDETSADFTLKNPRICFHQIGLDQEEDEVVLAYPDRPELFVRRTVLSSDDRYLFATVTDKGSGINRILCRDLGRSEKDFIELYRGKSSFSFLTHAGEELLFLTDHGASHGRIISLRLSAVDEESWSNRVQETKNKINSVSVAGNRLVVQYLEDARPVMKIFDMNGKYERTVELPGMGGVGVSGTEESSDLFYSFGNLFNPGTIYHLDLKTGESRLFRQAKLNFSPEDYVLKQVFYRSKDGTRIPLFIAHKKSLELNGKSPLWMYGYGHGGWAAFPWFQAHLVAWMDLGGVYALPGLRGGGEYGTEWRDAGTRRNKQNAIDDYIGAAEWLSKNQYTSPKRLVANGGSASGMVPAAAVTQRPDLFGAAVIDVPFLDMIRYPASAQGFTSGFGTPEDPEDFKVLLSYSPYHNVKANTKYPPILISAAEKDQSTVPWHCYKFAAAIQDAQGGSDPILLQVIWGAGHYTYGTTIEERTTTLAHQISFLVKALNLNPDTN